MGSEVKAKHTPGPWLRDGLLIYVLEHAGWIKGIQQFMNRFSADVHRGPDCDFREVEANARLMQFSPDLLVMLKRAVEAIAGELSLNPSPDPPTCNCREDYTCHGCFSKETIKQAKSLIAKAEGN